MDKSAILEIARMQSCIDEYATFVSMLALFIKQDSELLIPAFSDEIFNYILSEVKELKGKKALNVNDNTNP